MPCLKMNGGLNLPSISTDALSRLAAVAGDSSYSRRISVEDERDRQDVSSHSLAQNTLTYSLPPFRDSAPGDNNPAIRFVSDEPLPIPTHQSDTINTSRLPPAPIGMNDLQLIEMERKKLLGYEDELVLQDHILTHEKILLQKKIEEASLFAIRQMRLFTKDELTSRFYDIEKIICKQDTAQRYRDNGKLQLNPNDSSGLRSVLHRILVEETMPLTWSESRFSSSRDLNPFGVHPSSQLQVLEHLKDSSLWNGRATSSLGQAKFSSDHNSSLTSAVAAPLSAGDRLPFDSMHQEAPRKRSFQEEFDLLSGQNHGSVPDPLAYLYKKSRPDVPNVIDVSQDNQGKST